jgi:hypothetical protein
MTATVLDRAKLVRVLGMLGSDHPGEAAAAGRAANAMLQRAGIAWADIIVLNDDPEAAPIDVDAQIKFCLGWGAALTAWERDFLRSINHRRHQLSDKQVTMLIKIVDRVRACVAVWAS